MKRFGLACALLLAPSAAMAGSGGYLDLFYVPTSDLELSDPSGSIASDGGKGFGLRGRVAAADALFLQGEYQKNEYDGFEGVDLATEVTNFRLGLGISAGDSGLYGVLEHVKLGLDAEGFGEVDESGYGAHIGMRSQGPSCIYGQVGFLDVGDAGDGMEFMIGATIKSGDASSLFVDYRNTTLEADDSSETEVSDLRAGIRIAF